MTSDAAALALRSREAAASLVRRVPPDLQATSVITPETAAPLLEHLGFLASPDLPDRPGPAYLLVALRDVPTLRHYDPESIEYWATSGGRGVRREITRTTPVPLTTAFSWGLIRIVDRLHVSNEYLTFGGELVAGRVDDAVIAALTSPVPLLRRGGHSQAIDAGADAVGAFFGRFLLAIDFVPGFERVTAEADPVTRYAAFLVDARERSGRARLWETEPELASLIAVEARRLEREAPAAWLAGVRLRDGIVRATSTPPDEADGGSDAGGGTPAG
ncbi:MAG TPA: hypothetical protein VFP22_07395 [Candidatus Limnocylindrales bacterium]|nr:hypothetical protein [Candidatus Limnocylindrales bacterium]